MELSQSTLDGLILAGDNAHVSDKSLSVLVTRAFDGLLDDRHKNLISKDPSFRGTDQAIVKEAYAALVTLVSEASKYDLDNNHLERVNEAVYLVSLKTEVPGSRELKEVQFSCTQEQLQDLVGKLKDACKCLEKVGQI
ncbi:COMD3-like protein [Mya arenaria]|uniref:COMM domain-containing protein 3 n=1 Tax=Mya arenaria TaxID=6604 RepID=A0ABY7DBQ2_MYAAR|nr:COMD3-like protein [Mya arenaria]